MKRTLLPIIATLVTLVTTAGTVSFNFADNEFDLPTTTNTSDQSKWLTTPITKQGVTITPFKGTATIGALLYFSEYNNTLNLRFYKGSWFTITSTTGNPITQIEFKSNGKLAVEDSPEGQWTGDTYETWVGNAGEVRFDVTDKAQINSITVTTDDNATSCAPPVIEPTFTRLYSPTEVTISCLTNGATVHFTTDETEPTRESPVYTKPFVISSPTTVKAIATKGTSVSTVTSAQFSFPPVIEAADLGEFIEDETGDEIKITTDLTTVYHNAKYLYVTDGKHYLQVYGELPNIYSTGDIIPAGMVGTRNVFHGSVQMIPVPSTFLAEIGEKTVIPISLKISEITPSTTNTFVKLGMATLTRTKRGNYYDIYASDDTGKILIYNRFKNVEIPESDGIFDILGFVNYYDDTIQIYPIAISDPAAITDANSDQHWILDGNRIYSPLGKAISVYTLDGKLFTNTTSEASLPAGVFVVSCDGHSHVIKVD